MNWNRLLPQVVAVFPPSPTPGAPQERGIAPYCTKMLMGNPVAGEIMSYICVKAIRVTFFPNMLAMIRGRQIVVVVREHWKVIRAFWLYESAFVLFACWIGNWLSGAWSSWVIHVDPAKKGCVWNGVSGIPLKLTVFIREHDDIEVYPLLDKSMLDGFVF